MIKTKTCKNCGAGKRVYYAFNCRFLRKNQLYCEKRGQTLSSENGCENWITKKIEYDVSSQRFDRAEEDLNWLIENSSDTD